MTKIEHFILYITFGMVLGHVIIPILTALGH